MRNPLCHCGCPDCAKANAQGMTMFGHCNVPQNNCHVDR